MSILKRIEQMEARFEQWRRISAQQQAGNLPLDEWLEVVSPGMTWDAPHLVYIRAYLDRITAGELRKLMIFVPPRHGKSQLVTVRYPAWLLERKPDKRVIIASYSAMLAESFSRNTRRICRSRMLLSDERSAASDWETAIGGGMRAVGVGGGVTGRGGDLIVIDDPIRNREEANSQAYRERVWDWYRDALYTRQEPGAAIILILTRWHEDDLAGRILQSSEASSWTVVTLPALAEAGDPLGRAEGAALWPDRYDEAELARTKATLGSSFEALYQQRPSALEGAIFKREWWRYYREAPRFHSVLQSWDTAFKKGQDNDYSVCTTWGQADNGYYLLDVWKRRVEFPELKAMVDTLGDQYRPNAVLVEDKASGQSLIQELQRDTRLPILAIKADTDKVSRAYAVTPIIEAGRVLLPESAPWLADYLDSMASFPNAAHDDDVDSTTQALNYLIGRNNTTGLLDFLRQQVEEQDAATAAAAASAFVRMRPPFGVSSVHLCDGTVATADAAGIVLVPQAEVATLTAAGFVASPYPA